MTETDLDAVMTRWTTAAATCFAISTVAFAGCGPGTMSTDAGGTDAVPGTDAAAVIMIPPPGASADDWGFNVTTHGSPETAYPVGTVSMSPGYLDGFLDAATGDAFYVFQTGPAFTQFSVSIFPTMAMDIEFIHVHDGDGLVFGPAIPADMSTASSGSWTLLPDHVYVLEIHGIAGAFY